MILDDNETSPEIHPSHEDVAETADGTASSWMRERVLDHADSCERCRFVLAELVRESSEIVDLKPPQDYVKPLHLEVLTECPSCKAKINPSCGHCPECGIDLKASESKPELDIKAKREPRPWRRQGDTFFFWIAGCMFILALMFPLYNMHFLLAGAFFGILAIIDYSHRNIFAPLIRAWREGDEDKASEVIDQLRDRFKTG